MVANLPDEALDLIEIAALVYAVDASVPRGGPTDPDLAEAWYRRFVLEVPVRNLALWTDPEVRRDLEETLLFLSGDRFRFDFVRHVPPDEGEARFFEFGDGGSWRPDAVMLFSGGLDSFAGALEEIVDRRNKVALVSHFSSTKLAPIQRQLLRRHGRAAREGQTPALPDPGAADRGHQSGGHAQDEVVSVRRPRNRHGLGVRTDGDVFP